MVTITFPRPHLLFLWYLSSEHTYLSPHPPLRGVAPLFDCCVLVRLRTVMEPRLVVRVLTLKAVNGAHCGVHAGVRARRRLLFDLVGSSESLNGLDHTPGPLCGHIGRRDHCHTAPWHNQCTVDACYCLRRRGKDGWRGAFSMFKMTHTKRFIHWDCGEMTMYCMYDRSGHYVAPKSLLSRCCMVLWETA